MINPVIEESKSSVDSFELPCGYLDVDGNLHTSVDVREITGPEEEIMSSRNMPIQKKVNKILARCTTAIGPFKSGDLEKIIPDLTQGDRFYLMFAIRRVSLGDEMPFVAKCPECGLETKVTVDLSELEVQKMADPKIRTYPVTLPRSKKNVAMKVLTGRGEDAISKALSHDKDWVSTAIFARVENIDGKPVNIEDILALGIQDREFLRDVWQDHEGGIDTDVDMECPQCSSDYKATVGIASEGFFNPLAVLRRWKNKSST